MKPSDNAVKAFVTAALCTLWIFLANSFNLIGWAGFAGCTAYFAYSKSGEEAIKKAGLGLISGSMYALVSIFLSSKISGLAIALFMTFLTTFLMCYAGKTEILSFVPAAFMGSFSTFAAQGNLVIIPSLLIGVMLGLCCDKLGQRLTDNL